MGNLGVRLEGPETSGDLRFLTYSHDGFGLGHLRRSIRLASALVARSPGASVLAATGSSVPSSLRLPPGIDYLKIPSVAKVANGVYVGRTLPLHPPEVLRLRAGLLSAAVKEFRPHLVLVDRYPLGLLGELREALDTLRTHVPDARLVLGLRDVIDQPATVRAEWQRGAYAAAIAERYDLVLIYGSRGVYDLLRRYRLPAAVRSRAVYTGYLCEPPDPADAPRIRAKLRVNGSRLAVCTVGGGEDGFELASTFVQGMRVLGDRWSGVLVAGPMMSRGNVAALKSAARGAGVRVRSFVEHLPAYLDAADVVVSMGGYNTLCEALSVAARAVVVPRMQPRAEQAIRAGLFGRRGLVEVVEPAELRPDRLAEAMRSRAAVSREDIRDRIATSMDLAGLQRSADALMGLVATRRAPANVIDLRAQVHTARTASAGKAGR